MIRWGFNSEDHMKEEHQIYDCFVFFHELDILELRLNILSPHVDYFILVEATETYMGDPKPLYYQENKARFAKFADKIIHIVVDDMPKDLDDSWDREALQRSAFGRGLTKAKPHDLVIVSDVDEIVKPDALREAVKTTAGKISYFEGVYYHFLLNWRLVGRKDLKTSRMIEMKYFRDGWLTRRTKGCRSYSAPRWMEYLAWLPYAARRHRAFLDRQIFRDGCWHFSFMLSPEDIRKKLSAYSHFERNTEEYVGEGKIEQRIDEKRSMFDNQIEIAPLEEMPAYVQENLDRYGQFLDLDGAQARSYGSELLAS